jgi:tetratricopeptide (TPR) repeat protein/tRNA A-37 threonylcarbamoyl transferase component Bud32
MTEAATPEMTLSACIRSANLDHDAVLRIATRIGDELAVVHAAGRAHGRLTSARVLIRDIGTQPRVTLLGFAGEGNGSATSAYRSDRQNADASGASADVFAFGMLLREMSVALEAKGLAAPDWQEGIDACIDQDAERRPSIMQAMQKLGLPVSEATLPSAPPQPAQQSKRWGQFHLLQRLGQGAFGEVYRAWDPVIEREVALKLLLPRGLNPEQQLVEIVAEARAIARVRHPGIVSVYGVDRHDGRVGFWSDFVRGHTLQRLVETQGPLLAQDVAAVGIALCDALAAVHSAGLLHRDIKASNCMRDENGRVLLMDFGLSQDLQQGGELAGTPNYMAPELLAGSPPSVQSDVYAMGVLLLYLCTRAYPLMQPDPRADPLPAIPASLEKVIGKAAAREPGQRYATAVQLSEALRGALGEMTRPVPDAAAGRKTRRTIWMAAGAGIIVAVAILFPILRERARANSAGTISAAYQDYQAAEAALDRYDKPGNTEKAIALYQQVLERSPDFALAEAGLARADWRMYINTSKKEWADRANRAAANAVRINSNLAPVLMTAGNLHLEQSQTGLGMQELQQAQQLDPMSADVHAALAEAYRRQGRMDAAKKEFQTAIDLAPDEWRWPYLLGALELDNGDYAGAQASLKTALQKTPDNALVLYNLGVAYRKDNKLTEAQQAYEQSLALNPREDPMMALGTVFMLEGKTVEAVAMFQRAVKAEPSDFEAWGNLASAEEWAHRDPAEIRTHFETAIRLGSDELKTTPDDPFVVSVLARYYAYLHEPDQALPLIRKSLVLAPHDPSLLERDAEAYEELGHRSEALNLLEQALQLGLSPDYAKKVPEFKVLREDPRAPASIRD